MNRRRKLPGLLSEEQKKAVALACRCIKDAAQGQVQFERVGMVTDDRARDRLIAVSVQAGVNLAYALFPPESQP